jgi:ribonuclease T1
VFLTDQSLSGRVGRAVLGLGLAALLLPGLGVGGSALARAPGADAAVPPVALASLPPEAQTTYQLIRRGGPFPYQKDGIVFGNRERLLPPKARGHYHEYTVQTPGAPDRGARRIVCGGTPPTSPEACYYTADHYSSFRHIVPQTAVGRGAD